jgi:hypothetical protein
MATRAGHAQRGANRTPASTVAPPPQLSAHSTSSGSRRTCMERPMRNSSDRYETRLTCSCSKYWLVSFQDSISRSRTLRRGRAGGRAVAVGGARWRQTA